jgi:hypothetical protein
MRLARTIVAALIGIGPASAQVTFTTMTSADAFLATGSTNNPIGSDLTDLNFGGAGTLGIAPASSAKGEFQSVIRFDLSGATNLFQANYGTNWTIANISLELTSNYGTGGVQPNNPIFNVISGGKFVIEWLAHDDWVEGSGRPSFPTSDGITYNMLPDLLSTPHRVLCTNTYSPPGNDVHVLWPLPSDPELIADAAGGGSVSFLFYAADAQISYLFNSYFYGRGNEPLIHVTAAPLIRILSGSFTNGAFQLNGVGPALLEYQIQAASDPGTNNWQTMGTAAADAAGNIQFTDFTATNHLRRFYRLSR